MSKLLYTLTWLGAQPTIADIQAKYHLKHDDLDSDYGVVLIDPQAQQYAVMIEAAAVERIMGRRIEGDPAIKGPYSNPPIEPFNLQDDDS
jgi:hypothetical protein